MPAARILIVDDEPSVRFALAERLSEDGHRTVEAENGKEALTRFAESVDLVLLDYRLPDTDGPRLLQEFKRRDPDALVILLTAVKNVDAAVKVMKAGAFHYATKPFDLDEVAVLVEKALETTALRREVRVYRASQSESHGLDRIIGTSPVMVKVKALLRTVAASPASTVLLTGETGTGKDLAAKAIHYASNRARRPFMNITCSALTDTLLESELFGHERGAFTDARQQRRGLLESADGGTVFLDEIGEMTPTSQSKLLRVLEEKAFKRLGGTADIRVDVRIIAATNRDLEAAVQQDQFRSDLYYRLNVMPVHLPPLRERGEDIPLLAKLFVDAFSRDFGKKIENVETDALTELRRYAWPGNVRELRNAVERAMLLSTGSTLTAQDFSILSQSVADADGIDLPHGGIELEGLERRLVTQALERSDWNRTRAAGLLGMSREQIRYRIEKFGLERSDEAHRHPRESGL